MKWLISQSMRDHCPKLRFALKACTITALLAAGLILASCARNLTGTYMADDGACTTCSSPEARFGGLG
jgi:hypothetical protein